MATKQMIRKKKVKRELQVGDIFMIHKGQKVYVDIPGKFVFSNVTESSKDANELHHHDVKIGRVFKTTKNKFDTNDMIGFYVVTSTNYGGGGTGHGPHDVYPNGHRVYAKKLKGELFGDNWKDRKSTLEWDEDGFEISFYQSGSFTAMIERGKVTVLCGLKMKTKMVMATKIGE